MSKRIALITGGTGDIGTAICRHFCDLGIRTVASYLEMETQRAYEWQQAQEKLGYEIEIACADITQIESCARMVREIEEEIGPIDILVNNAGINRDATFQKMTSEQWMAVIQTDLNGLFNMTKQVIDGMVKRGFGRIINTSSVSAQKGQFGQTNYAAAKAGVHGFTKSLALEVSRKGVTVNTISPGFIESKMVQGIPEKIREQLMTQVPVGRWGKPEEIAWAVGFLASDNSGFITGLDLSINGGVHMY